MSEPLPSQSKRILLIHPMIWSHYKAAVFSALHQQLTENDPDSIFKVIHLSLAGSAQKKLSAVDYSIHNYPYELLHKGVLAEVKGWAFMKALYRRVVAFRPTHLILTGVDNPLYVLLYFYVKRKNIRLFITYDSIGVNELVKRHPLKEWLKGFLLKQADYVLCYGSMSKNYLQTLGLTEEKIKIRVQATNNQRIREGFLQARKKGTVKESRTLLFVGRLAPEKNLFTLLDAFQKANTKEEWTLRLVGAGPLEAELKAHVQTRQIKGVVFAGSLQWDRVVEAYAEANVFILPSTTEPWGLVVNEAMLCELPVLVSTHCGASADLVRQGINGFTFDPYDKEMLMNLLVQLMQTEEDKLSAMGAASYDLIQDYTPERSAAQMLDVLGFNEN